MSVEVNRPADADHHDQNQRIKAMSLTTQFLK
jgi:hypothetical protein